MSSFFQQFPVVFDALNEGFLLTLKLFFVTLLGALPLGLVIAFGSMSRFKPLSVFTRVVVWIVRGSPLMIQLMVIFYVPGIVHPPSIWGGDESGRFLAAAIAFIINYACYFSEIYRGGIQAVPVGQEEAGQVLGMTRGQIFFRVKLQQVIKRIVPPMSNEIITLVKDTSLARVISMQEIIYFGYSFTRKFRGLSGLVWPLFFTAVYYLVCNGLLTLLFGYVERKMNFYKV